MRLPQIRKSARFGAGMGKLGFRVRREPCEKCGNRLVFARASTGEFYCGKCGWGSLYPGTKERDEVAEWFS